MTKWRRNFLYVDIKVYPASAENNAYTGIDEDTILIAEQPVLTRHENLFNLYDKVGELQQALIEWINREVKRQGMELLHKDCPKAPGK